MKFNNGKITDVNKLNQPPNSFREAKNAIFTDKRGDVRPENGFNFIDVIPDGHVYCGHIALPDYRKVLFTKITSSNESRISILEKDNTITVLFTDDFLQFSPQYKITGLFRYNFKKEAIILYWSNVDTPRILNIDNLPFDVVNGTIVDNSDFDKTLVFSKIKSPKVNINVLSNGGIINSGALFFAFQYVDSELFETNYTNVIGPAFITNKTNGTEFNEYDGDIAGTKTNRSIRLDLTDVDTRYKFIRLIVIKKIEGIVEPFIVSQTSISGSSMSLTYTGIENETSLSLEELLTQSEYYTNFKTATLVDDIPYLANLKSEAELDLQPIANNIIINYTSKLIDALDLNESHKLNNDRGFAHSGVYAFYIQAEYENGKLSKQYHIPGRPIIETSEEVITDTNTGETSSTTTTTNIEETYDPEDHSLPPSETETDPETGEEIPPGEEDEEPVIDEGFTVETVITRDTDESSVATNIGLTAKKFQVEDTTNRNEQTYSTVNGIIKPTSLVKSNMGYWENSGEFYTNDFPQFANQKVRHHVFPTVAKCRELHYNGESLYGVTKLDVLGIEVSNINIPQDIKSKIKNIRICYAKRDLEKSTVVTQDIVQFCARGEQDTDLRWSSGGNWDVFASKAGGTWNDLFMTKDYLRLHSYDLLNTKPSISPSYIQLELKLSKSNLNAIYTDVGKSGGKVITSGSQRGRVPTAVVDYTDTVNVSVFTVSPSNNLVKLNSFKYIPYNVKIGNISTRGCEEAVYAEIDNHATAPTAGIAKDVFYTQSINQAANTPGSSEPILAAGKEDTYLFTVKQLLSNVYSSYKFQEIVYTNYRTNNSSETVLSDVYGGDVFVSYTSFISPAPMHEDMLDKHEEGIRIFRAHIAETAQNINLRHYEDTDKYTMYYPKFQPSDLLEGELEEVRFKLTTDKKLNTFAYNEDYTSINTLIPSNIYDELVEEISEFPYRIIRGNEGTLNNFQNSWRKFLSNDIYERNSNKGEIINIESYNGRLLIHHLYGLYITVGKERLLTSTVEITLGTGDIFSSKPTITQEGDLGYIGTQHRHACIITPYGYLSIDAEKGHIHLLGETLDRISNRGNSFILRDILRNIIKDKPLTKEGISVVYDDEYNRLIFSFMWKEGEEYKYETWTYSNELGQQGAWLSIHEYCGVDYIRDREKLFSINENKLYQHNIKDKYCIFYNQQEIKEFEITVVFNQANNIKKLFSVLKIDSSLKNNQSEFLYKTLTSVECTTFNGRTTGEITLKPFEALGDNSNIRYSNKGWLFNRLYNVYNGLKNKQYLIDYYMMVTLKFNNEKNLDNSQNLLYLYSVEAFITQSNR